MENNERETKFQYIFKNKSTGNLVKTIYSLQELENIEMDLIVLEMNFEIIARREYTGLNDKNGVEIYEGDIVRREYGVGYTANYYPSFPKGTQKVKLIEVEWDIKNAQFKELQEPNDPEFHIKLEVIGNIYENPELLKEDNHESRSKQP